MESLIILAAFILAVQAEEVELKAAEPRTPLLMSSFTYGLIIGQLSVLVVFILFIRFFIFADPPQHRKDYPSHIREQRQAKILPSSSGNVSVILEKTYYNVETHSAESLDWFTVLIAQAINHLRDDARKNDNILKSLDAFLNGNKVPDFIDTIKVTELNIGDDYPIFSNCKIMSTEGNGLNAQIDVDLTDTLTLGIETRVLLNFPKSLFAFLPVSLSVSIVRFSGRLTVTIRNLPVDLDTTPNRKCGQDLHDTAGRPTRSYFILSFSPDYRLEFNVKSLVGARSKLQDVPKIGQIVESRLRRYFTDRLVDPHYLKLPLPMLWKQTVSENTATDPISLAAAITPAPGLASPGPGASPSSPLPKRPASTPRTSALEDMSLQNIRQR